MAWLNIAKVIEEWATLKVKVAELEEENKRLREQLARRSLERKC